MSELDLHPPLTIACVQMVSSTTVQDNLDAAARGIALAAWAGFTLPSAVLLVLFALGVKIGRAHV